MKRLLKLLHIAAAIGFVGTLAVSLLLAATFDMSSPSAFAQTRRAILVAADSIAVPSLVLSGVTGMLLVIKQPLLVDARWVWAKALLGVLVAAVTLLALQPAVSRAAALSALAAQGSPMLEPLFAALRTERLGGSSCLLLSLLAIALPVWRPRLGKPRDG
jgi:uncharacterized membrane protein